MKWPKIRIRRADVERVMIACSAVLVLLLSVQSRHVDMEPYEEPLEEIPVAEVSVSSAAQDMQDTVVYYEDGDGYLVPVQREVLRQEGIAKATLNLMVQSARNDMDAARLGLVPVVPEESFIRPFPPPSQVFRLRPLKKPRCAYAVTVKRW